MIKRLAVGAALIGLLAGSVLGQTVAVGDPAPKLAVGEFVKGESISELKAGTVYVVEFWATWCGPCKASIPHLSELAKKYDKVKFIGANVWERDQKLIKPFVEEMGDKMGYNVATDKFEGDDKTGAMATTWMKAAGQNGIPCAFIVNDEGKIAWIGHPMSMDDVLPKVIDKSWDIAKAAADFKAEAARKAMQAEVMAKLRDTALAVTDRIKVIRDWFAEDPAAEPKSWSLLMRELAKLPDKADMVAYVTKVIGTMAEDGMALWNAAYTLLQTKDLPAEGLKVALDAAKKADQLLGGKHDIAAGILCRAYTLNKDKAKAVEAGERAVTLAAGKPYLKMFTDWLDEAKKLPDAQ